MFKLFAPFVNTLMDIRISPSVDGPGVAMFAEGDSSSILSTFFGIFSDTWAFLIANPALLAIVCVAVGAPILGVVLSLLRGR